MTYDRESNDTVYAIEENLTCPSLDDGGANKCSIASFQTKKGVTEYDDEYPRVVVMFDARTRVVECGDGIQWSIQKCGRRSVRPWRGVLFFRSKAGLIAYSPVPTPFELLQLPDWFPERSANRDGKGEGGCRG